MKIIIFFEEICLKDLQCAEMALKSSQMVPEGKNKLNYQSQMQFGLSELSKNIHQKILISSENQGTSALMNFFRIFQGLKLCMIVYCSTGDTSLRDFYIMTLDVVGVGSTLDTI